MGDQNSAHRIYRFLAHFAHCDREVDVRERTLLEHYRKTLKLDEEVAKKLEQEGARGMNLIIGEGDDERDTLLGLMVEMIAADGILDPNEIERLEAIGSHMGLPVDKLIMQLTEMLDS